MEHTDNELLKLIYKGIQETQTKIESIEKSVNILEDKQRDICITLWGDESKQIRGLAYHIESLRNFMDKYKKWEFAIGLFLGFFGFIGTLAVLVLAVLDYFKK